MERSSDKTRNGPEIVAFIIRAVLNGAGKIARSELCFCHCPLAHDRATVLDTHSDDVSKTDTKGET